MKFFFSLLFITATLISCEESGKSRLPGHSGKEGDVLLVIDNHYWNGVVGDSVKAALQQYVPLLPQPEYMFNVITIEHRNFSPYFKTFRNIVVVDIEDKSQNTNARVETGKNRWASDQLLFFIKAKNTSEFLEVFSDNNNEIVKRINLTERSRVQEIIGKTHSKKIADSLKVKHGLSVSVPLDFEIISNEENFVWISGIRQKKKGNYSHFVQQGILIHHYPYENDSTFSYNFLTQKREEMAMKIPGANENSFMTTEYRFLPPQGTTANLGSLYAYELRGLWKMVNDFKGGPFINLTTYDEARNRIVTVEGYVFAPNHNKREYLREVEAMVYSLDFSETPETND